MDQWIRINNFQRISVVENFDFEFEEIENTWKEIFSDNKIEYKFERVYNEYDNTFDDNKAFITKTHKRLDLMILKMDLSKVNNIIKEFSNNAYYIDQAIVDYPNNVEKIELEHFIDEDDSKMIKEYYEGEDSDSELNELSKSDKIILLLILGVICCLIVGLMVWYN